MVFDNFSVEKQRDSVAVMAHGEIPGHDIPASADGKVARHIAAPPWILYVYMRHFVVIGNKPSAHKIRNVGRVDQYKVKFFVAGFQGSDRRSGHIVIRSVYLLKGYAEPFLDTLIAEENLIVYRLRGKRFSPVQRTEFV
jgi:hypothetical protein